MENNHGLPRIGLLFPFPRLWNKYWMNASISQHIICLHFLYSRSAFTEDTLRKVLRVSKMTIKITKCLHSTVIFMVLWISTVYGSHGLARVYKLLTVLACRLLGLYSPSGKTSYSQISWSLEAARLGVMIIAPLWNLTSASAARLRDFTRSCSKTSYRLVNRGPALWVGYETWPAVGRCQSLAQCDWLVKIRTGPVYSGQAAMHCELIWPLGVPIIFSQSTDSRTALTVGKLPTVRAVKGDCKTVYKAMTFCSPMRYPDEGLPWWRIIGIKDDKWV